MPNSSSALLCSLLTWCLINSGQAEGDPPPAPSLDTFSIVARDPVSGELGIAVQSKIVAVGSIVPFASAKAGAIATQALANVQYGPLGLAMLQEGASPQEILARFAEGDPLLSQRQVALLPVSGPPAAWTGPDCSPEAGHLTGEHFAVQGNLLASADVLPAMAQAFEESPGFLEDRLIAALRAGQAAGGDLRGRQSAALLVVRQGWGYAGGNDRFRDLRVDDHPEPIEELARILDLHRALFPRPEVAKAIAPPSSSGPSPAPPP